MKGNENLKIYPYCKLFYIKGYFHIKGCDSVIIGIWIICNR